MHELSLAGSVLQIVENAAIRDTFKRVRSLHLSVPALAGVEIEALRFALQSLSSQTVLDGAEVFIEVPASSAHCLDCHQTIEVSEYQVPCPRCGSFRWQCSSDRGIRVVDLLVE